MDYKNLFVYFIIEREDIRLLKEAGFDKPWTDDNLLATTRFTNINRENDKVTRWIREHVEMCSELISKIYLCRMFNRIDSLGLVDWNDSIENICDTYIDMMTSGRRILTSNAYMLSARVPHDKGDPRGLFFAKTCKKRHYELDSLNQINTCSRMYDRILEINDIGVASFLAGQIIADVKNTKGSYLYHASDKNSFVCHGPGSLLGLSYYTGKKVTPTNFHMEIINTHEDVLEILDKKGRRDILHQLIDMQNFQNCFCEFSKYCKLSDNPRAKHRIYD